MNRSLVGVDRKRNYECIQRRKWFSEWNKSMKKCFSVDFCDRFRQMLRHRFILATFSLWICLSNFGLLVTFLGALSQFGPDATRSFRHPFSSPFHMMCVLRSIYGNNWVSHTTNAIVKSISLRQGRGGNWDAKLGVMEVQFPPGTRWGNVKTLLSNVCKWTRAWWRIRVPGVGSWDF
jgi:hypothetical protein